MNLAFTSYLMLFWIVVSLVGAVVFLALAVFRKRRRRRFLLLALSCLAAIPIFWAVNVAIIYLAVIRPMTRDAQVAIQQRIDKASLVKTGDRAPAFRVHVLDGPEFSLDESRGKVVLLNFFATWCGPCMKELPHMQKLWNQYGNREDFAMLVLGREESGESVRSFVAKYRYSFPVASDLERSVYSLYARELVPRTYLIGRDGAILFSATGYDEAELQGLKEALGKELRVAR